MTKSFTVGTPPLPPPPIRLALTVTSTAITLTTAAGKPVRGLVPGTYSVVVRDRTKLQNARLIGPGVNRATSVAFVGTATWKMTLSEGALRYRSDVRKTKLRAGLIYLVA